MHISTLTPLPASRPVQQTLSQPPPTPDDSLKLFISLAQPLALNPALRPAIARLYPSGHALRSPYLLSSTREFSAFTHNDRAGDLLKAVGKQIAYAIGPRVGQTVEVVFLCFGARSIYAEWKKPDADKADCLLKTVGLGVEAFGVAQNFWPGLQVANHWSNGIDFGVKIGGLIHQGKATLDSNDMMDLMPSGDGDELARQLVGFANAAVDPGVAGLSAIPLPPVAPSKPPPGPSSRGRSAS